MRNAKRAGKQILGFLLCMVLVLTGISPIALVAEASESKEGNIINNPLFANGSNGMDGWSLLTDQGGEAKCIKNGDGVTINISNAGSVEWSVQLCQENMKLSAGKKYEVSIDVVSSKSRSIVTSLQNYDASTYTASNYGSGTTALKENERTTIQFKTTKLGNDVSTGKLYIGLGNVDGASVACDVTIYSVNVVPIDGSGYNKLVWSDEFDGDSLNMDNWSYEYGNGSDGWGNAEQEYYTDRKENISVGDGQLKITAKREDYEGFRYTSARIKTQGKKYFKYGRMEARIKLDKGQGNWPAFWMLGENIGSVGWPRCGEIDIMEWTNHWNYTVGTLHWASQGEAHAYNTGYTYYNPALENLDVSQWHTYAVEWDEYAMHFLVDGHEYYVLDITDEQFTEFHENQFFLLNVAVGGNFVTEGLQESDLKNGKSMYVDYVRVYQEGEPENGNNQGGNDNGNDSNNEDDHENNDVNFPEEAGTSEEGNIINHPLFDNGIDGWYTYTADGTAAADFKKNEKAGLDVDITSVGSMDWHVQLAQDGLHLEQSNQYKVSVDLISSAERSVKVALEKFASGDDVATYGTRTEVLKANERTTISFTTDNLTETTDVGKLYIGLGNVSGNDVASKMRIYSVNVVPVSVEPQEIKVTEITTSAKAITLKKGETQKIDINVLPAEADNKELSCISDHEEVATMAHDGTITANNPGTATISIVAQDGSGVTSMVTVTVEENTTSNGTPDNDDNKDSNGDSVVNPDNGDDATQGGEDVTNPDNDESTEDDEADITIPGGEENSGNTGTDETNPDGAGNSGNAGEDETNPDGAGNSGNAGEDETNPDGAGNSGNAGKDETNPDGAGNSGNTGEDETNPDGAGNNGNEGEEVINPDGEGDTGNKEENVTKPEGEGNDGNNGENVSNPDNEESAGNNGNNATNPDSESNVGNDKNDDVKPDNDGNGTTPNVGGNTGNSETGSVSDNNGNSGNNGSDSASNNDGNAGNNGAGGNSDNGGLVENNGAGTTTNNGMNTNTNSGTVLISNSVTQVRVNVGTTFNQGKYQFKVTNAATGSYAVELTGTTTIVKTVIVPATVEYQGMVFKVTSIGKNAFQNNKKLQSITIGKNIIKIGAKAFLGCKNLKMVKIKSSDITSIGKQAFRSIHKKATVKVPSGTLKNYNKLLKKAKLAATAKVK